MSYLAAPWKRSAGALSATVWQAWRQWHRKASDRLREAGVASGARGQRCFGRASKRSTAPWRQSLVVPQRHGARTRPTMAKEITQWVPDLLKQAEKNVSLVQALAVKNLVLQYNAPPQRCFHVLFQICMQLNHAEMIHALVEESRNKPAVLSAPCFTIAIKVACQNGLMDRAHEYWRLMRQYGIAPRKREHTALVEGYCAAKQPVMALKFLHQIIELGYTPPSTTFIKLLQCSESKQGALDMLECMAKHVSHITKAEAKTMKGILRGLGFEYGVHSAEDDGRINGTNMYLSSSTLSDYELSQVRNHVVTAQAQVEHAALANELQQFGEWLDQHGPFDIIVDGANVGHRDGVYRALQMFETVTRLVEHGFRPLIVLMDRFVHGRYVANDRTGIDIANTIRSWRATNRLFVVRDYHDDWFWMYAVAKLGRNAYMLSNDNMANHNFQNLGHNFGARWRHAHQVQYATRWRPGVRNGFMQDVAFFFPMRYQRTSHAADNGVNAIFFPIRERSRKPVQDDGCVVTSQGTIVQAHAKLWGDRIKSQHAPPAAAFLWQRTEMSITPEMQNVVTHSSDKWLVVRTGDAAASTTNGGTSADSSNDDSNKTES